MTFEEVIGHFRELKEDPTCQGQFDVFLDVSNADTLPNADQLAAVGIELRLLRNKVQFEACAVVATRDAMFGMMRVFGVAAEPFFRAIRVFRESSEAETWLISQRDRLSKEP